ncbi:unnamed protein product [Effrenium voratum]|nr:unnamed protein product [Effrenium voratum]
MGLPTIFAFYSAYFSLSLPLPLNFGRPLVRTQKVPNEGVEEMWSWRPYHLCPNPQRTVSTDLSIYEMHPKYEDIQDLLERSLHIEAGALLRVLRAPYDGQQPVVLLVAAHREALNTTQLVVAKVVWDTTDEEVGEHSRAGAELRQAMRCAQRAAGGVGSLAKQAGGSGNYFYDQSKRMALIALELKGSCLELAELQQAILSRNIQAPVVLLSEVLQTSFHRGELGGIHGALAPRMEGIIAQLAGPGGAVAQLMNLQRGSLDLLEAYHLENLPSIADPKGPRHNSHSIFHPLMGGMIDNLCRTCGLGDFRGQLLERLVDIQKVCQQLASKTWRKEAWRPLCHLAHGNLSPSSVLVDGNGETWLYNWGTYSQQVSWQRGKAKCGGVQPFFRDLARLSARLLLEGCVLPFSLRQAAGLKELQPLHAKRQASDLTYPRYLTMLGKDNASSPRVLDTAANRWKNLAAE